jgi:S1-C subfamily serine protease
LQGGDRILEIEGKAAPNAPALNDAISGKMPGANINIRVSRGGKSIDLTIEVASNVKKTYRLSPAPGASAPQNAIRNAWLRRN